MKPTKKTREQKVENNHKKTSRTQRRKVSEIFVQSSLQMTLDKNLQQKASNDKLYKFTE